MLAELRICGMGVIDDAVAEFAPGLSVLTGETGAGKTMVVTGLRLLAGGRADASRVRHGAASAIVEGRFDLTDLDDAQAAAAHAIVDDADGVADDDGTIIVTRRVGADGRSRAQLGGRAVPAGTLAALSDSLLAVHGQNDQLRLLRPDAQRDALDAFGGPALEATLENYRTVYATWKAAEQDLSARSARSREMAQEADMLQLGLHEIDALDPQPGEDDQLAASIRRMTDSESLRLAAASAHQAITAGSDDSDTPPIAAHLDELSAQLAATHDDELAELAGRIGEAVAALSDIGNELGAFVSQLDVDADALEQALARRHALTTLTRKYGEDITAVLHWADTARERLRGLDTSDDAMDALKVRVKDLREAIVTAGTQLSAQRRDAATALATAVSAELAELAMGSVRLDVQLRPTTTGPTINGVVPTEHGLDTVEMVLTGPAGTVPLGKGASGGELSRVMLALEVVLAESTSGGTLVFDEVDAGVGGRAALSIGRRLALLARTHQVLAVTHLAQVAAYADTHLVVRKESSSDAVISAVSPVDGDARVKELARMLAGMDESDSGLAHAHDLLSKATAEKARDTS